MFVRCANDARHKLNGKLNTKSTNHFLRPRHALSKRLAIVLKTIFQSCKLCNYRNRCGNRTVKKAYHVACKDCAKKEKICAKCLKSAEVVSIEPPEPTPEEQLQLKVEMDRLIKSLPERKRRTFLRFMKRGKEAENEDGDEGIHFHKIEYLNERTSTDCNLSDNANDDPEAKETVRIPHSRADLLNKFESLKVTGDSDEDGDSDENDSDFDFEDGSNESS